MRRVYFLRHAEAAPSAGDDKARHLSSFGAEQASQLGAYMKSQNMRPDAVLCSSAIRTQETFEKLSIRDAAMAVSIEDGLYNAPEELYFEGIRMLPPEVGSVMVVGHNPGISAAVFSCARHCPEWDVMPYEPCTLAVFELDIANWNEFTPSSMTCLKIVRSDTL
ncbi:MAG: histidine phosphatase family protein [Pseudobdellovibrionaceae bacterium]